MGNTDNGLIVDTVVTIFYQTFVAPRMHYLINPSDIITSVLYVVDGSEWEHTSVCCWWWWVGAKKRVYVWQDLNWDPGPQS